mmetsp:Transcript_29569/g.75826  ORF Transcript_29569/g.75826 Transcript_29569/m.75826 type:complete len:125 (-) Transcript_29569:16-390(-)
MIFTPSASAEAPSTGAPSLAAARDAVLQHKGRFLRVSVFVLLLGTVRKAREVFFAMAGREAEMSDERIGQAATLSFFLDMCGFPIAGSIMDSYGRRTSGALAITLMAVGIAVLIPRTEAAVLVS